MIWLGGVVAIGLPVAWIMSGSQRRYRAVRDAPPTPVRDVVAGTLCRIEGRVVARETIEAPITGRRCVCFRATARRLVADVGLYADREDAGVLFELDDGTGRAIVDPTGAWVEVRPDHSLPHGTERTKAWLLRIGRRGLLYQELHWGEGVIVDGARVSVMGLAHREEAPDGAGSYRDGTVPTRVSMAGSRRLKLHVVQVAS